MDSRIQDLHCIMPIANLSSVVVHGLLSYVRAEQVRHSSVAMQPVQDLRDQKRVPGGLRLHQYANLYFNARNPMLFKRRSEADTLCVLSIALKAIASPGTVITDCNAASGWVRFLEPSQWRLVEFNDVLASDWTHPGDKARFYSAQVADVRGGACTALRTVGFDTGRLCGQRDRSNSGYGGGSIVANTSRS